MRVACLILLGILVSRPGAIRHSLTHKSTFVHVHVLVCVTFKLDLWFSKKSVLDLRNACHGNRILLFNLMTKQQPSLHEPRLIRWVCSLKTPPTRSPSSSFSPHYTVVRYVRRLLDFFWGSFELIVVVQLQRL